MIGFLKAQIIIEASLLMLLALLSFEKTLRKGDRSRLYLVAFLVITSLYISVFGICYFVAQPFYAWADAIKIPLVLTIIPLFFLFVSGLVTGKQRPLKQVLLHLALPSAFLIFIPFLILSAYLNGILFASGSFLITWSKVGHTVLIVQTSLYTLMFFSKFMVYSRRLQEFYNKQPESVVRFRYLVVAFSAFYLFMDNWLMSFVIPESVFPLIYSLLIFLSAGLTGWLGLNLETNKLTVDTALPSLATVKENILSKEVVVAEPVPVDEFLANNDILITEEIAEIEEFTDKEEKSRRKLGISRKPFDDQQKKILYKKMLNYLITNELYTDPKLTLKQLANDLDTNTRYLSMVINEYQGRNFNQMLNYYRVKKVMRLLVDNEAESYSYLGLAQKAGFHSKSVFIAAFKSQTGTTPSEFSGTMKKLIKS